MLFSGQVASKWTEVDEKNTYLSGHQPLIQCRVLVNVNPCLLVHLVWESVGSGAFLGIQKEGGHLRWWVDGWKSGCVVLHVSNCVLELHKERCLHHIPMQAANRP